MNHINEFNEFNDFELNQNILNFFKEKLNKNWNLKDNIIKKIKVINNKITIETNQNSNHYTIYKQIIKMLNPNFDIHFIKFENGT